MSVDLYMVKGKDGVEREWEAADTDHAIAQHEACYGDNPEARAFLVRNLFGDDINDDYDIADLEDGFCMMEEG